nr:hypothetical protein Iba_scaffold15946CG0560 [Ipomoea batatas]
MGQAIVWKHMLRKAYTNKKSLYEPLNISTASQAISLPLTPEEHIMIIIAMKLKHKKIDNIPESSYAVAP